LKEERERLAMEDKDWVEIADDTVPENPSGVSDDSSVRRSTRVLNMRTGEVRIKARDAAFWKLSVDAEGRACFVHRKTNQIVYENPKYLPLGTTPEEIAAEKAKCMEAVCYAAYFVADFLELHAKAATENERKVLFNKLHDSPAVKNLAGALMKARGLWATDFDKDEYLVYAQSLLTQIKEVLKEKDHFHSKVQNARRNLLNVEKAGATATCQSCGHEIARTATYCTVCGAKMSYYRQKHSTAEGIAPSSGVSTDDSTVEDSSSTSS